MGLPEEADSYSPACWSRPTPHHVRYPDKARGVGSAQRDNCLLPTFKPCSLSANYKGWEEGGMARFGIGQAVRRVEDERFLTGAGNYVGDITLPGELFGVAVYSTQAHARITRVDTSGALAAPGVVLVLTGADAVADNIGGIPPLAMPEDMGGPKG